MPNKKEYVKYFFDDKEFLESYHSLQYILNIVYFISLELLFLH
jgi:hypothetical protein